MQKQRQKLSSVTRMWSDTRERLMAQAMAEGLSFVEYLDQLSLAASGVQITQAIELPKKGPAIHPPSVEIGHAAGYAEALADLADIYHKQQLAFLMADASKIDFRRAAEWDNRILRSCGFDAPWGSLPRNHKRCPK